MILLRDIMGTVVTNNRGIKMLDSYLGLQTLGCWFIIGFVLIIIYIIKG